MKIKVSDQAAVGAALDAAQGRATACVFDAADVAALAAAAEKRLAGYGLPLAQRAGATYRYCPAGPAANAYRYRRDQTAVTLRRHRAGWYLVAIDRVAVSPKSPAADRLSLTAAQAAEAVRRFSAGFSVIPAVDPAVE